MSASGGRPRQHLSSHSFNVPQSALISSTGAVVSSPADHKSPTSSTMAAHAAQLLQHTRSSVSAGHQYVAHRGGGQAALGNKIG